MEKLQKTLFIILVFLILASIAGFYFFKNDKINETKSLNLQNNTQSNGNVIATVENAFIVKDNNKYVVKLITAESEVVVDTCEAYDENSKNNNLYKDCTYSQLSFSPNKNYLTYNKFIYESGEIILYDIKNKTTKSFPSGNTIGFTKDEKYLFVCSGNELAGGCAGKIYETNGLKEIYSVPEYYSTPNESPYVITKCSYDSTTEIISFTSEDIFNPAGSKLPKNVINYDIKNKTVSTQAQNTTQPSSFLIKSGDLLPRIVAQKAIDYINKNLLSDATATLGEVDNSGTINTLYQFTVSVSGKSFASYVSADGKYLFAQEAYNLTAGENTPLGITEQPTAATKAIVQKAIDYINKNLMSNGTKATLDKINNANTINKLYKFTAQVTGNSFNFYVSSDGKYLFVQESMDLTKNKVTEDTLTTTIEGNFKEVKDTAICTENNKPIVYFFGSASCSHCIWEKPVLESVIDQFGSTISYHENIDSDKDKEIFAEYSSGSIPTLVIGCKYYRIGSGEAIGIEAEKLSLQKVICRATGNLPANICQ